MRPISPHTTEALLDAAATRVLETVSQARLPTHTLMARAGLSVAQLARALAPHARCIWVACGPGNNGGDGLVAAHHLHQWSLAAGSGLRVVVTHWTDPATGSKHMPADARQALQDARASGVAFAASPPAAFDLAIDAVFGIGRRRSLAPVLRDWLTEMHQTPQTVLSVDVPSLLEGDTGACAEGLALPAGRMQGPRYTLSLLSLKPGLFTAHGRDLAGRVWLDDLQTAPPQAKPTAWLAGRPAPTKAASRPHASHKGSFGDVAILGGQDLAQDGTGMTGAAVLAARAALQAGAGRVFVGLLGNASTGNALRWDPHYPELMFRAHERLLDPAFLASSALVCGCGGGSAVASVLPQVLAGAPRLVLDADALNAMAESPALQAALAARHARGWTTVITPHPLEAARLLGSDTPTVMADRLAATHALAERFQVIVVLKGSGTVIQAPGQVPLINPTGHAALATAGTGDVLAGMIGSALALPAADPALNLDRVAQAVFQHGWLADHWEGPEALRAGLLAQRVMPLD
jgi:ADP-dependent NAD(P)H-hydrate dehydratase / NAD(P)H-hydrate epimerase